ncbi:3-dehydroquinate synthase [Alteromonas flava]|uniref:3-dehydroquinate synthase n=1 Tax=Alteromonas flava TaxID=2048003 RepID=UPI000C29235D|nr:3-dehydroquinate synthase [Alteromonas flava]
MSVTVDLGDRSYPIIIAAGLLSQSNEPLISNIKKKAIVVTNTTIAPLYLSIIQKHLGEQLLHTIIIEDGEQHKTLDTYASIMTELLSCEAGRDTTLIALGGGVVGDLTGFVAATYQRGMPFIQIPTTLLAQVDSSVGGKTAVNHPLGKNMIGAFYQPQAVLIDTTTLATLPDREFAAGMAEVIKYGIIYDADFFAWLESHVAELQNKEAQALQYAIRRCCEIKAEIVAKDERESGIRALLNLGHTFGHAIEAEQGYGNWLHGEAVSAGIILACSVARREFSFSESEFCRVEHLLQAFGLPVVGPQDMSYASYMQHMRHDKKVLDSRIRFVIPTTIGNAIVTDKISDECLQAVLVRA